VTRRVVLAVVFVMLLIAGDPAVVRLAMIGAAIAAAIGFLLGYVAGFLEELEP
jgi:Na+-driven multidrug efflux pump